MSWFNKSAQISKEILQPLPKVVDIDPGQKSLWSACLHNSDVQMNANDQDEAIRGTSDNANICITNPGFELDTTAMRATKSEPFSNVTGFNETRNSQKNSGWILSGTGSAWQNFQTSCMTAIQSPKSCAGIEFFQVGDLPPLKEIAHTVDPYNPSGWATEFDTFQATADILDKRSIGFFVCSVAVTSDIPWIISHSSLLNVHPLASQSNRNNDIADCNPAGLWHNDPKSCAGIGLFQVGELPPLKEIAHTVSPYKTGG